MKLFTTAGSNTDHSYNRDLLKFVKRYFTDRYDIELGEVRDLPMLKGGVEEPTEVASFAKRVTEANVVLISTPEQQHSVPSSLKSALGWLSLAEYPPKGKPAVIVGTSVSPQGSARGQSHSKMVLSSPGFSAEVLNRNEFMMGTAPEQFGENDDLPDETVRLLDYFFDEFNVFYSEVGDCK